MTDRLFLALAACVPLAGGCLPSRTLPDPHQPWCAPGKRAELKITRELDDDVGNMSFWVDAKGGRHERYKYAPRVWAYLFGCGAAKEWPRVAGECVAPFEFTLVSITPTVVLMTPVDHGPLDEPTMRRLQADASRRTIGPVGPDRPRVVNALVASTELPYADGMKWFSDDPAQPPTPLVFGVDDTATITLPDGELSVSRDKGRCSVTRR